MVELHPGGNPADLMYWIQDDEEGGLMWSPGTVVEVRPKSYVLECIVSGDHFEIDKEDPAVVHPSCLGKRFLNNNFLADYLLHVHRWSKRPVIPCGL